MDLAPPADYVVINLFFFKLPPTLPPPSGAFVICWTPGLVTLLLDGLLGKESHANDYEKFCLVIAECNSLVNPIIYSLRDKEMRQTFKRILCCLFRRVDDQQRQPSPIEIDSPTPKVTELVIVNNAEAVAGTHVCTKVSRPYFPHISS